MNIEEVKEIKELLRCLNGEKACTDCYINEIAEERETFCINVIADMALDLINELESENERLIAEKQKILEYMKTDNYAKLKKEDMCWGYQMGIGMLEHEIDLQKDRIADLEKENARLDKVVKHYQELIEDGKLILSEQLQQFAERLKEKMSVREYMGVKYKQGVFSENDIDEALKEVVDERN